MEVDYSSQESLVNAIRGHEVLIACLMMDIISQVQPNLIEAALIAGVRRYIPSEYSGITLDPGSRTLPLLKPLVDQQEYIKKRAAEGRFEYTIFAPGGFPHLFVEVLLDFSSHTAFLYDGGNKPVSMSSLDTIAMGIAAALQDSNEYKNSVVKFHDGTITQQRALEVAKSADPSVEWKIVELNGQQTIREGMEALSGGASFESMPVLRLLSANVLAKEHHFGWTAEEDQSKKLGLQVLGEAGIEALVAKRARGESIVPA